MWIGSRRLCAKGMKTSCVKTPHGMKRAFDLLVSLTLLVLLALPLCAIGLVILLKEGHPVLFRQTRIGRHGTPFSILKFRTMRVASTGQSRRHLRRPGSTHHAHRSVAPPAPDR